MATTDMNMSKTVMITTGWIEPDPLEAALRDIRVHLVFADSKRLNATWSYDVRSPFWRLYINRGRGGRLHVDGRILELVPGIPYLLPAGVHFGTSLEPGVDGLWQDFVHFSVEGVPAAILRDLIPGVVSVPRGRALDGLVAEWSRYLGKAGPGDLAQHLWTRSVVHAVLAAAIANADEAALLRFRAWLERPWQIRPALAIMAEDPVKAPSNAVLARSCGLGERQFLRKFRELTGCTPGRHLREQRIARAATALATGDEPIERIAARLGFADRFHFSKTFRMHTGVAPGTYRRMFAGR
jgi:AraC-like DNA-binding protein